MPESSAVLFKLCAWEWIMFEWSEHQMTNLLKPMGLSGGQNIIDEVANLSVQTESMLQGLGWQVWTDCPKKCSLQVCLTSLNIL